MVETASIGALGYVMWGLAAVGSTLGIYRAAVAVQGVWAQQARSPEGKLSMEYIAFAMFPASQVLYPFIPQFMKQHLFEDPQYGYLGVATGLATGLILLGAAYAQGCIAGAGVQMVHETEGRARGQAYSLVFLVEGIGIVAIGILVALLP
jgi:F0F1-type ATP synthase membrane subunit c/vacuolar-type H+-ATPase subunit K